MRPGTPCTNEPAGASLKAAELALTLLWEPIRLPGPTVACMPRKTSSSIAAPPPSVAYGESTLKSPAEASWPSEEW
jgi:hypothetical protein